MAVAAQGQQECCCRPYKAAQLRPLELPLAHALAAPARQADEAGSRHSMQRGTVKNLQCMNLQADSSKNFLPPHLRLLPAHAAHVEGDQRALLGGDVGQGVVKPAASLAMLAAGRWASRRAGRRAGRAGQGKLCRADDESNAGMHLSMPGRRT